MLVAVAQVRSGARWPGAVIFNSASYLRRILPLDDPGRVAAHLHVVIFAPRGIAPSSRVVVGSDLEARRVARSNPVA